MASFINRLKTNILNNPGVSGDITIGSAVSGFVTFGSSDNGKSVDILITEGNEWELSKDCIYTHSSTSLTRGSLVSRSSAFAFTNAAQVAVILLGERILSFYQSGAFKSHGQALVYDQFEDAWTNSNNTIPDQAGNEFLFLTTDGSVTSWASAPQPSLPFNDLTDVIISSPVLNQTIKYNGTHWVNSTVKNVPLDPVSYSLYGGL